MRSSKGIAAVVLVLALLAIGWAVGGCESLEDETTTTEPESTTTTWPSNTTFIDEGRNGGSVQLDLGDILVLRLQANPSTGYSWRLGSDGDPILKAQGGSSFIPESDALGAGGVYQAVFLAATEGVTFLALDYVGPDDQVDHNYYVDVIVGAGETSSTTTLVEITTTSDAGDDTSEDADGDDADGDDADGDVADGDDGDGDGTGADGTDDDDAADDDGTDDDDGVSGSGAVPATALHQWGNADLNALKAVVVGDRIKITLDIPPDREARNIEWENIEETVLQTQIGAIVRETGGPNLVKAVKEFLVIGVGEGAVIARFVMADGTTPVAWWINVVATAP